MVAQRRYSQPVDRSTGLIFDQILVLQDDQSAKDCPESLRGVCYQTRRQVEFFFCGVKQHLHVKAFFGTTECAAKSEIWVAVSVYVLVAIVRNGSASRAVATKFYRF